MNSTVFVMSPVASPSFICFWFQWSTPPQHDLGPALIKWSPHLTSDNPSLTSHDKWEISHIVFFFTHNFQTSHRHSQTVIINRNNPVWACQEMDSGSQLTYSNSFKEEILKCIKRVWTWNGVKWTQWKIRTRYYVVRNAGCARSRYTLKLSLIFLINELTEYI